MMSDTPADNNGLKNFRRFWGILFYINVFIGMLALILVAWTNVQIRDVNAQTISLGESRAILEDRTVTADELVNLYATIQSAEESALGFLGVFESIAFGVSVLSIVIVATGLVAAVLGFSNFSELRGELESTRREMQGTERDMTDNITQKLGSLETELRNELETTRQNLQDSGQKLTDNITQKLNSLETDLINSIQKQVENKIRANIEERLVEVLSRNRQAWTLISLAERDLRQNNIESALRTFKRAYQLDEENPLPSYYLGSIALTATQEEAAKGYFEKAIQLDGEFYRAVAALGFTLRRMGEKQTDPQLRADYFMQAEEILLKALGSDPYLVDFEGESWHGSLAGLYLRTNRIREAKYHYHKAREVTPLSSYPTGNLARIAIRTGSKDEDINALYEDVNRLARLEISNSINNYWAQADLLTSILVLGEDEDEALRTLRNLIDAIPELVFDVLPRVYATINEVRNAPTYPDDKRDMTLIDRVLQHLQENIDSE